jgi:RsiW-degrading membrane proteinase PrsW (M82 family)
VVIGLGGLILATLPVLVFLALLIFMDSFKLVPLRVVLRSVIVGAIAAAIALVVNTAVIERFMIDASVFRRYVAPPIEELAKSLYIAWLVGAKRTGFAVDAAIHGFAVGTGFALVENVHYLRILDEPGLLLWAVRGFGTAVTHGSTTAVFACITQSLFERRGSVGFYTVVPGFAAAVAIHSLFNHFVLPPLAMTAVLMVVMPILFILVFERSEKATRDWIGTSFDSQMHLLDLLVGQDVRETRVGTYLKSLRDRLPPLVVSDMLCLLRVQLELSIRAKAQLMARQAGIQLDIGADTRADLEEMRYLEKAVGKTGILALQPLLPMSSRDLWQLYVLRA